MRIRKFKRFVCIALSILLAMSNLVYADNEASETVKCPDIAGNKYEAQLREWVDNGFITGDSDGNFKPDKTITRAEFMALVNRSFGFTDAAEINYTDVRKNNWFYKDAAIATKMGYMQGSSGRLNPQDPISRQEVAIVLARLTNNRVATDIKNIDSLSDGKSIPDWSRAAISIALSNGYFEGLIDNAFKPAQKATKLETVVSLDRAFKSMYKAVYMKKGIYGPADGMQTLEGSAVIVSPDVTLRNTTVNGDLILRESIGNGNVYMDNVVVKGTTIVKGGGEHSIVIRNSSLGRVVVRREGNIVRIVATGSTTVGELNVQSGAVLEEEFLTGEGFGDVVIPDDILAGATIVFEGNFDDVQVDSGNANINVASGTIGSLTLTQEAAGTSVNLSQQASVGTLNANASVNITGQGTIQTANVNAQGVNIEQRPQNVVVASGVTATVGNQTVTPPPSSGDSSGGGGGGGDDDRPTVVSVNSVTVSGANNINTVVNGGTLQMSAVVSPANATNKAISWSIIPGTGAASISATGLLTATGVGTVTVKALNGWSGISGTKVITIVPMITNVNAANASTVTFNSNAAGATIKWNGKVLPTLTMIGVNTITVPLMVSGESNTLLVEKSGFTSYINNAVVWNDPLTYEISPLGPWENDRTAPDSWKITDGWITYSTKDAPANNWYAWHGKKTSTNNVISANWKVETEFKLTDELLARDGVRTSMWLNVLDEFGENVDWSIVQFNINKDTGAKGWQYWNSDDKGAWVDISADLPTAAGVYKLAVYYADGKVIGYINGVEVFNYAKSSSKLTSVKEVILNSYSFGESYQVEWKVPTVSYVKAVPEGTVYVNKVSELDAALGGSAGTIRMAPGTYELDKQIRINRAINIIGAGDTTIITKGSKAWTNASGSKGHASLITIAGVDGEVKLENLKVTGAANIPLTADKTDYGSGINVVSSSNVVLNNITSTNNAAAGLIVNSSDVVATNLNTSGNSWYGVNVDKSDSGNARFELKGTGVLGEDIEIKSDNRENVKVTVKDEYKEYEMEDSKVTIWNKKPLKNVASITNGTTKYYSTIQAAIDDADNGYTVNVAAGTYDEDITINRSIKLYGANAKVNPNNSDWTAAERGAETIFTGVITASADVGNIEIDGFKFAKGEDATGGALDFRAGGYTTIKVANSIADNTYYGSGFMYVSGQRSNNVEFVNNRLINTHGSNTAGTSGVLIWSTDNIKANGNYFYRTSEDTGMTSNAALNLLSQNGDMVIQNNYFEDMIIKLDGTNFNANAITDNVFTGRAGKSNILEFTTIRTPEEIEFLKKNNTYSPEGLGYVAMQPVRIGDKGYATIQAAIDAAVAGNNTIKVYPGVYEYKTESNDIKSIDIIQKVGVNITLEAVGEVVLKNQIRIDGDGRYNGEETLTIKGFTFDFSTATFNDIITTDQIVAPNYVYAHNIFIEDCTFIGKSDKSVVAVRAQPSGGHHNFQIKGCIGNNLHSLAQLTSVTDVIVQDCSVSGGESGLNLQNSTNIEITKLTVDGTDYGVRAGQSSGTVNANNTMTISDSELKALYPIWLRGDAPGKVTIINSTLTPLDGGKMINNLAGGEVNITIVGDEITNNTLMTPKMSEIEMEIADTTVPVITLVGEATISLTVGDDYVEAGATAVDEQDGDLTAAIVIEGTVDTSIEGVYTITYKVSDAAGNTAEATRTVIVEAVEELPGTGTFSGLEGGTVTEEVYGE